MQMIQEIEFVRGANIYVDQFLSLLGLEMLCFKMP